MCDRAVNATRRLNAACRFAAMLAAANTAVVAAFAFGTRLAPAAPKHRPQTAHRSLATAGLWADPVSAVIAGVAAIGRVAQPFVPVDFAATCSAGGLFGESGRTTTGTTLAAQKLQPGCKPRPLRYGLAESIHAATARADQRHRHDRQPTQIGLNHVTVLVTGKLRIRQTSHPANRASGNPQLPRESLAAAFRVKATSLTASYRPQNRQNPKNRYNQKSSTVRGHPRTARQRQAATG
jgi:hypothetical protein